MLNTIGVEHSRPFSASRVVIRFAWSKDGPAPAAQIDGEEYEASEEATIEVVPRVIRLVVPEAPTQ
jgi:diacylglycerol kinase family enzyme